MAKWDRVPVKCIDRKVYGRTVDAYRHESGALLLHHKPNSRFSKAYRYTGVWILCKDRKLIRRRYYYGNEYNLPPMKWANRTIETFLTE